MHTMQILRAQRDAFIKLLIIKILAASLLSVNKSNNILTVLYIHLTCVCLSPCMYNLYLYSMLCYIILCCIPLESVYMCIFLETVCMHVVGK